MPKTPLGMFHTDGSGYARFQISEVTKHLQPDRDLLFLRGRPILFLKGRLNNMKLCLETEMAEKVNCTADKK